MAGAAAEGRRGRRGRRRADDPGRRRGRLGGAEGVGRGHARAEAPAVVRSRDGVRGGRGLENGRAGRARGVAAEPRVRVGHGRGPSPRPVGRAEDAADGGAPGQDRSVDGGGRPVDGRARAGPGADRGGPRDPARAVDRADAEAEGAPTAEVAERVDPGTDDGLAAEVLRDGEAACRPLPGKDDRVGGGGDDTEGRRLGRTGRGGRRGAGDCERGGAGDEYGGDRSPSPRMRTWASGQSAAAHALERSARRGGAWGHERGIKRRFTQRGAPAGTAVRRRLRGLR